MMHQDCSLVFKFIVLMYGRKQGLALVLVCRQEWAFLFRSANCNLQILGALVNLLVFFFVISVRDQ